MSPAPFTRLAATGMLAVLAGIRADAQAAKPLLVAGDNIYAPLSYVENGAPKGLDVDLLQAVARAMHRDVRIELMDWQDAQRRVLHGDDDALTDMGVSEERRKLYDFSRPLVRHEYALFVRAGDAGLPGATNLTGRRVGVTPSGFPRQFLQTQPDMHLTTVANYVDGFGELARGDIDAMACDTWVASYYIQRRGLRNITVAGAPFATTDGMIAVRKGNAALLGEINHAIASLEADGTIARIEEQWQPQEMLFVSRQRAEWAVVVGGGAVAVLIVGGLSGWIVTLKRQMAARRETQSALVASEEKFASAFRNSPDSIAITEFDGPIVDVNDRFEELTGYRREEILGRRVVDLGIVDPKVRDEIISTIRRDGRLRDYEYELRAKSGDKRTMVASAERVTIDGKGYLLTVNRDITDKKRAEEARRALEGELRQSQKMDAIGRLAAGVAHDFNNLLTLILGTCEVASPMLEPNDPMQMPLNDIRFAAERAAALTNQLLAFSRRQMSEPRVVDVNAEIGEIRRLLERLIGEDVTIEFTPAGDVGCVRAEPGHLQQIVINLAVNARDAMPQGGRLSISTRRVRIAEGASPSQGPFPPGDYVSIALTDTGVGMDADTRERIFEPFFTTKPASKGTGLGLATVYGIVKQAGGHILVDSLPNAGTTFTICLPREERTGEVVPLVPAAAFASAGVETLLLVEDEDDVRVLLQDYLSGCGYTVISARNGEEALALAGPSLAPPALLITDMVMPGMNGRVLGEQLRMTYPDLRVLYLSGYTDDAVLRSGTLPKGTRFLQKPFTLASLAGTVRTMIDGAAA